MFYFLHVNELLQKYRRKSINQLVLVTICVFSFMEMGVDRWHRGLGRETKMGKRIGRSE